VAPPRRDAERDPPVAREPQGAAQERRELVAQGRPWASVAIRAWWVSRRLIDRGIVAEEPVRVNGGM
jgi:hypothetical protein